ncbi:hypothetical protein XENORESO_008999 [Xenotaenia resolanae]|uniref:Uncharacterized protein n=1 Tax=Xenotaenia resolanae TaxID=208358 RepID=A0ABV0WXJ0_9TELE
MPAIFLRSSSKKKKEKKKAWKSKKSFCRLCYIIGCVAYSEHICTASSKGVVFLQCRTLTEAREFTKEGLKKQKSDFSLSCSQFMINWFTGNLMGQWKDVYHQAAWIMEEGGNH